MCLKPQRETPWTFSAFTGSAVETDVRTCEHVTANKIQERPENFQEHRDQTAQDRFVSEHFDRQTSS